MYPDQINSSNFERDAQAASQQELQDTMRDVTDALDPALELASDLGDESVARTLDKQQLAGHPLGARFDSVSVEYSMHDDPSDPRFTQATALFVFQRFAGTDGEGSIGVSEIVTLTEDSSGNINGIVLLDEGGQSFKDVPVELPQPHILTPEQIAQSRQQLEIIRASDKSSDGQAPESNAMGSVTVENIRNIEDAITLMQSNYAEMVAS
jgi:hypothetical protein